MISIVIRLKKGLPAYTHMNVLENSETRIIGNQLGIFAIPHRKYATGTIKPYLTSGLSKGWKYPSYGACLA
jgi:hypothetical protein